MEPRLVSREFHIKESAVAKIVFGEFNTNLRNLSERLGIDIKTRGSRIILIGDEENVEIGMKIIQDMYDDAKLGYTVGKREIKEGILAYSRGVEKENVIIVTYRGKRITPKTKNQKRYVEAISGHDMVFAIGPAGTGKTYLAVAVGLRLLKERKVAKLVLSRPAVEAGEKLGYLPGGIMEKVDPYLRPLYDAIFDILEYREATRMLERGEIEVIPLAFMRGRTLSDAYIILDEAQNTTYEQMKMFLTRMGFDSKVVITGDVTQIDLQGRVSGLVEAEKILRGIDGIAHVEFSSEDVVRHPLVTKVISAFAEYERERE